MSDPQEHPFQAPPPPPQPEPEPPARRPTRLRPFAIGFFALGLIWLVLAIIKVASLDVFTGVALGAFGGALFGLSFVPLPRVPDTEAPIPAVQKVLGIFYEPTRVFRNLRVHPHWIVAFVIVVVMNLVYTNAFVRRITPERIVNHTVEKLSEMGPPFAPPAEMLDDIRTRQLEQLKNPVQRVATAIKTFCGIFLWSAGVSAIAMLAVLAFGGRINFWQSISVYLFTLLPIVLIQKLLSLVILYIKSPDDLHPILGQESLVQDNLGVLFSPSTHPVMFAMASMIGVLSFYGLWLRSKGLNNGGTRVSSGAAWGVAITFWVIELLFRTILTALFPGFIG